MNNQAMNVMQCPHCLKYLDMSMTTKHVVPLKNSNEQLFMPNKAMANRKDHLKGFGDQIFMVDDAEASMSMLCSVLSSSQLLNMTTTTKKRMVKLKSSDEAVFEVDEAVANESMFVKDMIQAQGFCCPLGLNVSSKVLIQVIEYCKYHVENRNTCESKSGTAVTAKWDADSVSKFDQETLFGLMLAAKELRIQSLLDLVCQTVANMITGKPVEEIRKIFNIENDFTPEEEDKIRNENKWAFDTDVDGLTV